MEQKATFNQKVAGWMALLILALLGAMYFVPTKADPKLVGGIIGACLVQFANLAHYLIGSTSGSQAKDASAQNTLDRSIDALAKSAPPTAPVPIAQPEVKPVQNADNHD